MTKKAKWFWGILVVAVVAGAGWLVFFPSSGASVVTTDTVKKTNVVQTVEMTGDVQSMDEVNLAFGRSGTVDAVLADVGDSVSAGDVLAVLDAGELDAAYAQALGRVQEAEANLTLKETGVSSEEQAVGEADVSVAQAALNAAQSSAEHVLTVTDAAVREAESALAAVTSETTDGLTQAQEDLVESIRSLVAEVRSALGDADTVLGVENTLFNVEFDDVLSNRDAQALISATNAFVVAAESRNDAEDALIAMEAEDQSSVAAVADASGQAYEDAYETLLQTSRVLDATAADSAELSLDDLKTFKATISAAMAGLVADGAALSNARQAYGDAVLASVNDVQTSENALASVLAARDRDVAQANAAVASREADLLRAQAAVAKLVADPRDVDLAVYGAMVVQARADADAALSRLRDAQVIAPIDGILTSIGVDPGESVTAGVSVATVLSAGLNFEISLNIPEADVAKTRIGQPAVITFDAFGDDAEYQGSLYSIDPAQKLIEGVVFYEAKVAISSDKDLVGVKPGMSANVTIETGRRDGALAVPSRAVLERDNLKYVRIPSGDAFDERTVSVGLRGDGGFVEILNGVQEGETIIVSIRQ